MEKLKNLIERCQKIIDKEQLLPNFSSTLIISYILKINRLDLNFHLNDYISDEKVRKILSLVDRRKKGEPLYYLLGEIDFYNLKIFLTKDVLIPRPETEEMVDLIVKNLSKKDLQDKILLDLCTGSGCIAIALKKKFPELEVIAIDVCEKALDVAKKNASLNQVEVNFLLGDLFTPLESLSTLFKEKKIDFLTCNPPYISKKDFSNLSKEVREYEPQKALIAEENGLYFYKKIEREMKNYLKSGANIFFEIGYDQKEDINKIFNKFNLKKNYKDLSLKDRFFFLELE